MTEPEATPIFDALVDEWPDHLQRLRAARVRSGFAAAGQGIRRLALLMSAVNDGLREGLADD